MRLLMIAAIMTAGGCTGSGPSAPMTGDLPASVTNNAVAYAKDGQGRGTIYSFLVLGPGKTYKDIVTRAKLRTSLLRVFVPGHNPKLETGN